MNTSIPVRFAPLIAGNAPVRLPAVRFVRFEPFNAGKVDGNLPFGIVPDAKFVAFKFVRLDPLPEKLVAVTSPVMLISPVPVIFLLFRSRLPPSWGVVSCTISDKPEPVSYTHLTLPTKA